MNTFIGNNVNFKKILSVLAIAGMLPIATSSLATEVGGVELSGSGFMTVALGKMLGGSNLNVMDYNCPCSIADYAHAAVYDNRSGMQWQPDSKLGLQGTASFADRMFSVTAQVVSRGAANGGGNLEWFYGSYKVNDNLTIQAGRKRLPMFYYSDTQDIGVALPWTHLPSSPYGWEVVNYNGINMAYQNQFGNWTASANVLAGNETNNDSGYWKVYGMGRQSVSNVQWSNIFGGNLTLSNDWFETRIVYIQNNTQENSVTGGWNGSTYDPTMIGPIYYPAQQQIYGLAFNADYNNWLLRSEFMTIIHPGLGYRDYAQLIGVGYHYGKWQPMITGSEYVGRIINLPGLPNPVPTQYGETPENMQQTLSLTLRYDLTTSSDLKIQYDSSSDTSSPAYQALGYDYFSSQLLTFAYDVVF